jgi:hypothetical protein
LGAARSLQPVPLACLAATSGTSPQRHGWISSSSRPGFPWLMILLVQLRVQQHLCGTDAVFVKFLVLVGGRRVEYHVRPTLFSQQALLPPSLSAPKHESGPLSRQQILLAFLVCALPCSYSTTPSTIRRPSRAPYHHPKGTRPRIGTARILTSISAAPTTIAS